MCKVSDCRSYLVDISGSEAESILKKSKKRNSYLTRFSDGNDSYTVSVIFLANNEDKVIHLKLAINNENSSFSLEGTDTNFHSLDKLLRFYECSRISSEIRNLGSPCIQPILQRKRCHTTAQEEDPELKIHGVRMKDFTTYMTTKSTTLPEQNKEYQDELSKYQEYLDNRLKEKHDQLSRATETQRIEEERRCEIIREEHGQSEFQLHNERIEKLKDVERQKEENQEEEKKPKIKDSLQEQALIIESLTRIAEEEAKINAAETTSEHYKEATEALERLKNIQDQLSRVAELHDRSLSRASEIQRIEEKWRCEIIREEHGQSEFQLHNERIEKLKDVERQKEENQEEEKKPKIKDSLQEQALKIESLTRIAEEEAKINAAETTSEHYKETTEELERLKNI